MCVHAARETQHGARENRVRALHAYNFRRCSLKAHARGADGECIRMTGEKDYRKNYLRRIVLCVYSFECLLLTLYRRYCE